MKSVRSSFLILLLLLSCVQGYSQAHLTVTGIAGFPDSVTYGTNAQVSVIIQNTGTSIFQGTVEVLISANPGTVNYLYYSALPVLILPGDTLGASPANGFTFTSPAFRPGNNVVVVWPYTTQAIAVDSFITSVFVDTSALTGLEVQAFNTVRLYPVPATDVLNLSGIKEVEYVRILTSTGEIIIDIPFRQQADFLRIPLTELSAGIYLCELTDRNNYRRYLKFIIY